MTSICVAAFTAGVAELCTYPLDTIKTRVQYNKSKNVFKPPYYTGFSYALLRQTTQCGINYPLYNYLKTDSDTLGRKIYIASFCGFVGAISVLPLDFIKIKYQISGTHTMTPDLLHRAILPTTTRAMTLQASGIVVYDYFYSFTNNFIISSVLSGISISVLAAPLDTIKTRILSGYSYREILIMQKFFSGLSFILLRYIPWSLIRFGLNEYLNSKLT